MAPFVASLLGGLVNVAGTVTGRVLIALGIGVVAYNGMDTTLGWLESMIQAAIAGLPADLSQLLKFMGVGEAVSIIFGALTGRLTISGIQSGVMKEWAKL